MQQPPYGSINRSTTPVRADDASYRDYQNVTELESLFQGQNQSDEVFHEEEEPVYIQRQAVESILRAQQQHMGGIDPLDLKIKMAAGSNQPRCRDSGNWSGDRNSASSSSSTSMDNPYHYLMLGRHHRYC